MKYRKAIISVGLIPAVIGFAFLVCSTCADDQWTGVANVKDFGAVGDGIADDTAAIQAALSTTAKFVYIPDGVYTISDSTCPGNPLIPVLHSSVANRKIYGPGVIRASKHIKKMLQISGDYSSVQLNVDGNYFVSQCIIVKAKNCIVINSSISRLDSIDYTSVAILFELCGLVDPGGIITGNEISNIFSHRKEALGLVGARAITVHGDANTNVPVIIHGNIITNIIGYKIGVSVARVAEADSIHILGSPAGTIKFPAIITNNTITTWTRRAIKIQTNGCQVLNNKFTNTWDESNQVPDIQSTVDLNAGGDHIISGNAFNNCNFSAVIKIYNSRDDKGNPMESYSNFVISDNLITGILPETTSPPIYIDTGGENVVVQNNVILAPDLQCVAVSILNTTECILLNNVISLADNVEQPAISISNSCSRIVVTGNTLLRGCRKAFVLSNAVKTVANDNINLTASPGFIPSPARANNIQDRENRDR